MAMQTYAVLNGHDDQTVVVRVDEWHNILHSGPLAVSTAVDPNDYGQ